MSKEQTHVTPLFEQGLHKISGIAIFSISVLAISLSSFSSSKKIETDEILELPEHVELPNQFVEFKEAIALRESGNDYTIVNSLGYVGKYQIGTSACIDLNTTKKKLLSSKKLQEKAFESLCSLNKYRLRKCISKYKGRIIKNIEISEAGILSAAHLLCAENVKRWLKANGNYFKTDAYGTTIDEYMIKFGKYNIDVEMHSKVNLSE